MRRSEMVGRLRFLALAMLAVAGCTGVPEGVTPVGGFDADRYLGTWYEIARLDHRFERGLECITADYAASPDGSIRVVNRGYDVAKGQWRSAEGRARFLGERSTASLGVSFFGPFQGGYHVIALDPDYRWSMVSGPDRDFLWILARQPTLDAALLDRLTGEARALSFDTGALIYPKQGAGCPPLPG